jgi:hypothetical protein
MKTTVSQAMKSSEAIKVQFQGYGKEPEFALIMLPESMKEYSTPSWFIKPCDKDGKTSMLKSANIIHKVTGNNVTISFFEFGKNAKITQAFTVCEDQTIAK